MCTWRVGRSALLGVLSLIGVIGANADELQAQFASQLKQAESGNVQAMYEVGQMYELGMGTATSRTDALGWYRAAADQGHGAAAYQVGYAYYWGKGVKKDRRQAHVWFERAANAGNQAAIPYLSKMYALGQGVPQDKQKAAEWASRADTASNLYSPPPKPEQQPETRRAAPAPRPAAKPEPTPEAVKPPEPRRLAPPAPAAEPTPKAQATATPKAEAGPQAKPGPAARPKPRTKPAPKPKPRPQTKPAPKPLSAEDQRSRVFKRHWLKGNRPALYLPSSQTTCTQATDTIVCRSAARQSSLMGRPYEYQLVAELTDFTAEGGFKLTYRSAVIEVLPIPPGGYAEDSAQALDEDQLRAKVEARSDQMSCALSGDGQLDCVDGRDRTLRFDAAPDTPAISR